MAAACAGILYFLTYVPFLYISIREEASHVTISSWAKSLASLLSTTALALALNIWLTMKWRYALYVVFMRR